MRPVYEVAFHEPSGAARVPEALVQDVWRTQRFDAAGLITSNGTRLEVLDPGTLNTDSGQTSPVPSSASGAPSGAARSRSTPLLQAGSTTGTTWTSATTPSCCTWRSKRTSGTGGLLRADGTPIPELILYPRLQAPLRKLIHDFYTRPAQDLLCASRWREVPADVRDPWIDQLATERVREKARRLAQPSLVPSNLPELLHESLFAGLGYAKNDEAMRSVARRLPLSLTEGLSDVRDLEALHFGVAGLLPTPADLLQSDRATADYVMDLCERFDRLKHQFEIPVMEKATWRFFRLRPANFPNAPPCPSRCAAYPQRPASAEDPTGTLAGALRSEDPVAALRSALRVQASPFWHTHVRLETATRLRKAALGRSRIDTLIVNAVAPAMLLYAEQTGDERLEQAVWDVLGRLPVTPNEVTRRFPSARYAPGRVPWRRRDCTNSTGRAARKHGALTALSARSSWTSANPFSSRADPPRPSHPPPRTPLTRFLSSSAKRHRRSARSQGCQHLALWQDIRFPNIVTTPQPVGTTSAR